jgi:hypothetical protein
MRHRQSFWQIIAIIIIQGIALIFLGQLLPGLVIESILPAIGIAIIYLFSQILYWRLFIQFFSRLPAWPFPLISTVVTVSLLICLGNQIPGIAIIDFRTGMWIISVLAAVTVVVESYMSLDIDQGFDRYISKRLISKRGKPKKPMSQGFCLLN